MTVERVEEPASSARTRVSAPHRPSRFQPPEPGQNPWHPIQCHPSIHPKDRGILYEQHLQNHAPADRHDPAAHAGGAGPRRAERYAHGARLRRHPEIRRLLFLRPECAPPRPVGVKVLPRVYNIAERLAKKVTLPMPKVYLIPSDSPNAFATGRNPNHASVAVTQGILGLLTDDELEGVLAHELGHVRNRDILISSIAATLAGAITWLASIAKWGMIFGGMRGSREDRGGGGGIAAIAMIFLAPFAAMLIQLAVSRSREYGAD